VKVSGRAVEQGTPHLAPLGAPEQPDEARPKPINCECMMGKGLGDIPVANGQ